MCCMSWRTVMSGLWMSAFRPATTSPMLCGGILVAMPTAMPLVPLISRLGRRAGRTEGSSCGWVGVGGWAVWKCVFGGVGGGGEGGARESPRGEGQAG